MKVGRLTKVGNSWAVVIPAVTRRELRWFPGDEVLIEIQDSALLLRNTTQHDVQPITVRQDYGNGRVRRT